jgi:site-specific DNA-methyltransferase (adenine-specific)
MLCESLITLILSAGNEPSPDLWRGGLIQNGCLVRVAEASSPTGTMTITISLPTSDGSADPVTLSITSVNTDRGEADSAARFRYCAKASRSERDAGCEDMEHVSAGEITGGREEGSAGLNSPRAGAGRTNGGKNPHPTVKPLALMRYLCRLVTPPGGVVLDPFLGSGTTALAALQEGFRVIGMERDLHSYKTAMQRVLNR